MSKLTVPLLLGIVVALIFFYIPSTLEFFETNPVFAYSMLGAFLLGVLLMGPLSGKLKLNVKMSRKSQKEWILFLGGFIAVIFILLILTNEYL